MTLVDDFTRATWVFILKSKSEVYQCFVIFSNMLKKHFEINIKYIRSDNRTEFLNTNMKTFTDNNGILHQTSCVRNLQQNGVWERKHRQILNVMRPLLFQSGLPLKN